MRSSTMRTRRRSACPSCEVLESRALLATGVASPVPIPDLLSLLPATPTQSVSTVPPSGDVNPYGVANIPRGWLVTNFNNSSNQQGTGTTVMRITRDGTSSVFFQASPGHGLTTAIGVLRKGFVLVGSVPTTDGTSATVQPGSILILNRFGKQVGEISNSKLLDGPWDMTVNDRGNRAQVFISNVLSGAITRVDLKIRHGRPEITSAMQIATGYLTRTDPAALVVGPTGLAYNPKTNVLYVASTGDNTIYAITNAGTRSTSVDKGRIVYQDDQHLHGPLGMVLLPNGHLLAAQGDAVNPSNTDTSELVEFTVTGQFVDQFSISGSPGGAFGLAIRAKKNVAFLAAVNDIDNTLDVWRIVRPGTNGN